MMDHAQINDRTSSNGEKRARRKSVNVASVVRRGEEEVSSSECGTPSSHVQGEGGEGRLRIMRQSSINLATLFREGERILDQVSSPKPKSFSCLVDKNVVQQQTVLRMGTSFYEPEALNGAVKNLEVQFKVPVPQEPELKDDSKSPIGISPTKSISLRQRPVTFGAYYDDHNNEMIPELVEAKAPDNGTQSEPWVHQLQKIIAKAPPSIQMLSTILACLLTHALINQQPHIDLQITTMLLVTLCGATFPHLITAVGCGVYAGSASPETIPSYPWIVLLGVLTSFAWQIVSSSGLLLGYSGRLGATAFLSMNVTALIVFSLDRTVAFDRYGSLESLSWEDMPVLEEAVISLFACMFLACTAGYFRLISTVPVNPVLVPSAWALFCMLITSCTEYRFSSSVLSGYAVGAYVAMASEARLSGVWQFVIVGWIAGIWNVFLEPLFLGFGGKGGFTAMIAYSTYRFLQKICCEISATRLRSMVDKVLPR